MRAVTTTRAQLGDAAECQVHPAAGRRDPEVEPGEPSRHKRGVEHVAAVGDVTARRRVRDIGSGANMGEPGKRAHTDVEGMEGMDEAGRVRHTRVPAHEGGYGARVVDEVDDY